MKSNFKYYDRDQQMRLIGLRIHNNCMKSAIFNYKEKERLSRQIDSRNRCVVKMKKLQEKKLNIFLRIYEYFTYRRWFIIQERIIDIYNVSIKVAKLHDRYLMLAKYNNKQASKLK